MTPDPGQPGPGWAYDEPPPGPDPATERGPGAFARFAGWAAVDPARRWPVVGVPALWGTAEILHQFGVAWQWAGCAGVAAAGLAGGSAWWHAAGQDEAAARAAAKGRPFERVPVIGPAEAALAAGVSGAAVTAAEAWGVAAPPGWWPTWLFTAGAAGAYAWLNRHPAVAEGRLRRAAARDWEHRKAEWHLIAAQVEDLAGSHLLELTPTLVGHLALLDTIGTGKLATQINTRHVAERLGELYGLPRGRIDVWPDRIPGRLWVSVRTKNPWKRPVIHPLADPGSVAAPLLAGARSCRRPLVIGIDPETGEPLLLPVWIPGQGGQVVMIVGSKGSGKTNTVAVVTEALTACEDVRVLQVNLGKSKESRAFAGACAANALGSAELARARMILAWVVQEIEDRDWRSDDAIWAPTKAAPLLAVLVDEVDQVAGDPVCRKLLRLIASKCRSEGVTLLFAGQRATAAWIGGADLRANVDIVLAGRFTRPEEIDKAVGIRGFDLPDMAAYGEGNAGVWMVVNLNGPPGDYDRGRVLMLKHPKDMRRIAAGRGQLAAWTPPDPAPDQAWRWDRITSPEPVPLEAYSGPPPAGGDDERALPDPAAPNPPKTDIPGRTDNQGEPGKPGQAGLTVAGVDAEHLRIIMAAISRPGGASSGEIGNLIGRSAETARRYLVLIAAAGHATREGDGRAAKWHAAERPALTVVTNGDEGGDATR